VLSVIIAICVVAAASAAPPDTAPLRVCADPNNLPFTNRALEGFENRLAEFVAHDLGTTVAYTWWPQRRNFIRKTLDDRRCDVVMGMLTADAAVTTTASYYRSTYVFVTRMDAGVRVRSFDDPALRRLRIGVQLIGDDDSSPPAYSLSRRGIVGNIVGYNVFGEDRGNALVAAVAGRQVDVAVAWGPQAGYFAAKQPVPLMLAPVSPQVDGGFLPETFEISMAVRRGDVARQRQLDHFIARHRSQIRKLLADYHVPVVGGPP
jgi:mxaJ protein